MAVSSKGTITRLRILHQAREVMNVHGSQITLRQLATLMGEPISSITNHFPAKEQLFIEISREYDRHFQSIIVLPDGQEPFSLRVIVRLYADIMDLQYDYRCVILGITQAIGSQNALMQQVLASYRENRKGVRAYTQMMVQASILHEDILQKDNFETIQFQLVNLFTTWLLSLSLYDTQSGYNKMKPVYLKGIIYIFRPYFTKKALGQLEEIDFKYLSKNKKSGKLRNL